VWKIAYITIFSSLSSAQSGVLETDNFYIYLNKSDVRKLISVAESRAKVNFSVVSWEVKSAFPAKLDLVFPTQYCIAALPERGIRVSLYVGVKDYICNWMNLLVSRPYKQPSRLPPEI
jgi:hypothetical protein